VINDNTYLIRQEWVPDLNTGIEYLSFRIGEHYYPCHIVEKERKEPVTRDGFEKCITSVKADCTVAAARLVDELKEQFPDSELMAAFSIVYPQYWRTSNCEELLPKHLGVIKSYYGQVRSIKDLNGNKVQVKEMLSPTLLDSQAYFFKVSMKSNSEAALGEPFDVNPLTKLWQSLDSNSILKVRMSEYFKLAQIVVCCVIGSVEDERTFNNLAFLKSRLRNRLTTNLDCIMRIYAQKFFTLADFPYGDAIEKWLNKKTRRGVEN
jgi:hypothetical protein